MNRIEALEHFEQNYVQPKLDQKILEVESYLLQYRKELAADFLDSLRKTGQKIQGLQSAGKLAKVGFINYAMLRSAVLEKQPQYRIDVYNQEWYFDPEQPECHSEYDASRIFRFLDELESELETSRRRYLNQVTPVDLERIKLRETVKFNQLIIGLATFAINQVDSVKELMAIAKEDEFEIRVGEYYDFSEVVYKADLREKESEEIKEWLEEKHENRYVAAVLKNLDLSGGDYGGTDLRRVDFRGSNLSSGNLENCVLIKARLNDCLLKKTDFTGATIHDADFSGADLQQALFYTAEGAKGCKETMEAGIYSLWGVNFAGANLEGANFRYANLKGADFSGASLLQADFHGARLEQAIFNKAALPVLSLNQEQVRSIIWVD